MRASRLLSILMILQTRGGATARTLAEAFEVSERTIHRDIDQLSAAGVPVYADRGRNGGFRLLDGYRTRLTGLTEAEAEALFLAGLPGPAADMGLGDVVADVQLKLLAALPPDRQAAAERIGARFHIDPVGWFQAPDEAARLPEIARAVLTCRRLRVDYDSWRGRRTRDLEPLGLILKSGRWYLAARPGDGTVEPRIYRVGAVASLTVSDQTFERPGDFDLAAWWRGAAARFERDRFVTTARVRLTAEGLRRLKALDPAYARHAATAASESDGRLTLDVPIEGTEQAALDLLRLGAEAEVLAPPELRAAMAETVRALGRVYGGA
ncbi:MAG TPA: WYL domain-containing protein [Brevundimonas sp.]|jgi:predicted DNA-binding transcriptional regulator YafY|uniref:helix-turn-helix transcriptional regulator n=1 Tax=Brevundimonas sp. TaxID=1871086 RepID=UPI002E0D1A85|nr:WYL domain-containing protein [Brevundimonas sp.]